MFLLYYTNNSLRWIEWTNTEEIKPNLDLIQWGGLSLILSVGRLTIYHILKRDKLKYAY